MVPHVKLRTGKGLINFIRHPIGFNLYRGSRHPFSSFSKSSIAASNFRCEDTDAPVPIEFI